ncbi:mitochondrial glycoprotein family protein [Striga asiatica]|uniref:Mitochondrial glycoprotein family protein n=1 Tax=Striga asiatica TaxID=4170 RepID=A0A5A7PBX5_STRAF|nr:mitochondrial glycoprotein family protein [Striga asiatica]
MAFKHTPICSGKLWVDYFTWVILINIVFNTSHSIYVHLSESRSVLTVIMHQFYGLSNTHHLKQESTEFGSSSVEKQGSRRKEGRILTRLKRYGISGILSYGLLNTVYYLTTFLVVWFYVAPAPGRMGYLACVERFVKVMAMVWAGSQVTKLIRAGGALALAPFVGRGLSWFTVKFGFKSQGKAFVVIAGLCFGLAFLMFVVVTLLWA